MLIFFAISWRTISTPLISSPCIPEVISMTGPGFFERSTITGISTVDVVYNFARLKLIVALSPGATFCPNIVNILSESINAIYFYVFRSI